MRSLLLLASLAICTLGAPTQQPESVIGVSFDTEGRQPILNLPYARYRATYDSGNDVSHPLPSRYSY
jgi:hypothetical protein